MVQADQSSARGDRRLWVLRLRRRFRVKRAIKKTARATSAYTPNQLASSLASALGLPRRNIPPVSKRATMRLRAE
jgi:hypothetical protein